jgi:predicted nucleic acid-binding protein
MSAADAFFDTNVLLYLLSGDAAKANRAEEIIASGGVVSVQVLNEFAAVGVRKLALRIRDIREILSVVRAVCNVTPVDLKRTILGSISLNATGSPSTTRSSSRPLYGRAVRFCIPRTSRTIKRLSG